MLSRILYLFLSMFIGDSFAFQPPTTSTLSAGLPTAHMPSAGVPSAGLPTASVWVFVSSSMPVASLQKLCQDVERVGGRLVMRGLIDGSFPKTIQWAEKNHLRFDIHPPLFRQFSIQKVPTFVCVSIERTDRLEGDVTLLYVLEKMAQDGNKTATTFLKRF